PNFVQRCPGTTSFVVTSDSGTGLLVDCGSDAVLDTLQQWQAEDRLKRIDCCWITHYHDDHVDALERGRQALGFAVCTDEHVAEILEHPTRFFLPCISPTSAPVARKTHDGESWQWHEFTLTGFHFPGQSLYHSGLLVAGHGTQVFFAGDSGAPSGLDDYCCGNRNFLGAGRGFRRCIEIWRQVQPEFILNQHQEEAFIFDQRILDYLDTMLEERERLFAAMLPWAHPDFGTDEHWVRIYPYEQTVQPESALTIDVRFTNHGPQAAAAIEPVLPDGWVWDRARSRSAINAPARTDGLTAPFGPRPDRAARAQIELPADAQPGQYIVPFRITWAGHYLGQIRHAVVNVSED
ncbi:MAG: MBL fold metallo-hydrolase, partial [Anaerolineae bacterium]|nr:MBL fold metallo-hydrolase [Anaerolineae bacterium]